MVERAGLVKQVETMGHDVAEGAAWLKTNGEALHLDGAGLARTFRRFSRRARRLRESAERPPCVAVFGASQAGKSYLVSSIATSGGRPLLATYGTETVNFLRDLNPQGDKESTGLVSRFTTKPVSAPAGAPVPLRLLSQTDVVKILANAFLEDFKFEKFTPPDAASVSALFARLKGEAGAAPQGSLDVNDIEEMQEYFNLHFPMAPLIRELGSAYWAQAAEIIPRLPPRLRAQAYAPLWNNVQSFTDVAARLIGALEQLGFPDTAFCGMDALIPRETGVLNAETVLVLGQGERGLVPVVSSTGQAAQLDRSLLAALIAEITVPLREKPWDFFEHTDLLDFPGARTREMIPSIESFLAKPGLLGQVFLRGKVAYLFQRYNAEQEIAAMLLCVGPSNQEVQTLPGMISTWIGETIGATPEARARQRNPLFFVLTKFDKEFEEKIIGEDIASGERWTTRLEASMLKLFKVYNWPTEWTPGHAFNNCYWLRSPAMAFHPVFEYETREGGKVEVLSEKAAAFLEPRHKAYLANPTVATHFADPERAWQEGLKANDGGISYLAGNLRPVCDPNLKLEQVRGRLRILAADVAQNLRPHFRSGNADVELERARAAAETLGGALAEVVQAQLFGAMLRAMQVTEDSVASVYWQMQAAPEEERPPIGAAAAGTSIFAALGLKPKTGPQEDAQGAAAGGTAGPRHRFDRLADLALRDWQEGLQRFAEADDVQRLFHLPREQALVLVGELARAAKRLDLHGQIVRELHARASYLQRGAASAHKPVIIIEQAIDNFVTWLGFDRLSPDKRPEAVDGHRIFAPRPPVRGLPDLGEKPAAFDVAFSIDWIIALMRTMEDNVRDPNSGVIDPAQNAALGRILASLDGAVRDGGAAA